MRFLVALAPVLAAAVLAGCGASNPGAADEPAPAGTQPAASERLRPPDEPPPAMDGAPPPAWIATGRGSAWLSYASFCWTDMCADAMAPACGDTHVPDVRVEPGERVTFGLGFEPDEAALVFFRSGRGAAGASDDVPLPPARRIGWTATREGPVWLSARVGQGRDASYAACLSFAPKPLTIGEALERGSGHDVAVRGTLHVQGDEVRLCDGLAESYPPQCPGRYLVLQGADLAHADLAREGEVAWGEEPTTVRGTLDGATLVVAP